eukprot:1759491-Rhodomonas_salina.3
MHPDLRSWLSPCFKLIKATDGKDALETAATDAPDAAVRSLVHCEWGTFVKRLKSKKVSISCIIDFPFQDNGHGKLNLEGDDRYLERMYCFADAEDESVRVVLHAHTLLKWGKRNDVEIKHRADNLTSVNVRHAWGCGPSGFTQEPSGLPLVPFAKEQASGWREFVWKDRQQIEWGWRTPSSPTLPEKEYTSRIVLEKKQRGLQTVLNRYGEIQTVLKFSDAIFKHGELFESKNLSQTNDLIRGGEMEFELVATRRGFQGSEHVHLTLSGPSGFAASETTPPAESSWGNTCPPCSCGVAIPDPWVPHNAQSKCIRVLFCGANREGRASLLLENEYRGMKNACRELPEEHFKFEEFFFSESSKLVEMLNTFKPTILHISSHGEGQTLELSDAGLDAESLGRKIRGVNKTAHRVRLVILNACHSDTIARSLATDVDFVIGHEGAVLDKDAIQFSRDLYSNIARGIPLHSCYESAWLSRYTLRGMADPKLISFNPLSASAPAPVAVASLEDSSLYAGAASHRPNAAASTSIPPCAAATKATVVSTMPQPTAEVGGFASGKTAQASAQSSGSYLDPWPFVLVGAIAGEQKEREHEDIKKRWQGYGEDAVHAQERQGSATSLAVAAAGVQLPPWPHQSATRAVSSNQMEGLVAVMEASWEPVSPFPFVFVAGEMDSSVPEAENVANGWKAYGVENGVVTLNGNWDGKGGCGDKISLLRPSILHVDARADSESGGMLFKDGAVPYEWLHELLKYISEDGVRVQLLVLMVSHSADGGHEKALSRFADRILAVRGETSPESRNHLETVYEDLRKGKTLKQALGRLNNMTRRSGHNLVLLPSQAQEADRVRFTKCPENFDRVDTMCQAMQDNPLFDSYYSEADTASASETESDDEAPQANREALFLHNSGSSQSYAEHVKELFAPILHGEEGPQLSICGLLLCFAVDNPVKSGFECGDPECWRGWLRDFKKAVFGRQMSSAEMLEMFDGFEEASRRSGAAPHSPKKHSKCIEVINALVQKSVQKSVQKPSRGSWDMEVMNTFWEDDVLRDWFTNQEGSEVFLDRADRFLAEHIIHGRPQDGISGVRVLQALEMKSYGAFMIMNRLAADVLFVLLDMEFHWCKANGAGGECRSTSGFETVVCSDRRVFSFRDGQRATAHAQSLIVSGLRCLAAREVEDLGQMWQLPSHTNAGNISSGITPEKLEAHIRGTELDPMKPEHRELDDDQLSVDSTASHVSVDPTIINFDAKDVSIHDVQRARSHGVLSLVIQLLDDTDSERTILEIQDWGRKILAQFPDMGLEIGEPYVQGEGSRIEMQLLKSQRAGPPVKAFLRTEGYFSGERIRRVLFTDRRGEREVVVVEGAGRNAAVE